MSSKRCAISGEADREGRGAGGASTVSRFRLLRGVLLPWVAAAVMLFGGGLAALAQSFTPGSPECTASGTTVTCKGDLSDGVEVDAGADGTYTELYVNTLDGNIDPPIGTSGIAFTRQLQKIFIGESVQPDIHAVSWPMWHVVQVHHL